MSDTRFKVKPSKSFDKRHSTDLALPHPHTHQLGEISYGRIPAGSVVVSGTLPAADGSHSLYCAVIVKQVDAQTRAKVAINELLRDL